MKTRINSGSQLLHLALAFVITAGANAGTAPAAIRYSDIGAKATADYQGEALHITPTSDGARLRCGFQKLEGLVTSKGLWLESIEAGAAGKLQLVAAALGRTIHATPRFQPSITLPVTGTVSVEDKRVSFTRPGVMEEYSVSTDGVRQDFVITRRPAGVGELRLELTLSGARAEAVAGGARLKMEGSGRELIYDRLQAEDATGRELTAHLEVLSSDRLSVIVADGNAAYPVRIDPTFSDADWVSMNPGILGVNGSISAFAVDQNGNLYVGGSFNVAGTVTANYIAKWDGHAWSALGQGPKGKLNALTVNGTNLYAGGLFTNAVGVMTYNVVKWNGRIWIALGSGMDGAVNAVVVSGTNLYAGGAFTNAGGVPANYVAKWDGSNWSALGPGMDGAVNAMTVSGTNLYAGGQFTRAGAMPAAGIAKWDGAAWSALGSGMGGTFPHVAALAVSGTDLYVGGIFTYAGGLSAVGIARWNGAWSEVGTGLGDPGDYTGTAIAALAVSGSNLYAGGFLRLPGDPDVMNGIARWDGSHWQVLGHLYGGYVSALATTGTNLYAGGDFEGVDSGISTVGMPHIAKWDGYAWAPVISGMNARVSALAVSRNDLYAGGDFTYVPGGIEANYIAEWNGEAWLALGSGMNGPVQSLVVNGTNLYVGGTFTEAGGASVNYIARWNGATWSALGLGLDGPVHALALEGTNLYAGKDGGVARWDGSNWSVVGGQLNGSVRSLAVSGADLYAGGDFGVAQWDGNSWSSLGSAPDIVIINALAVSGGDLYAGGRFMMDNHVVKWDGNAWSPLGPAIPADIYALWLDGTNLYVGAQSGTEFSQATISRWDGNTWWDVGVVTGSDPFDTTVQALVTDDLGHLFIGGNFCLAQTIVSPFVAQANLPGAPIIVRPPQNQTAEVGCIVTIGVGAVRDSAATYLLYFNQTQLIASSTNGGWTLTNVDFTHSGAYTIVITNVFGAATSAPVALNVIPRVERRTVPAVTLIGQAGDSIGLDFRDSLNSYTTWETMTNVTLSSASQYCFDISEPLPSQRFYRAWQMTTPSASPMLDIHMVPALTLTGNVGDTLRLDYINRFGPTDAWVTLDTVTLTEPSQLYFDVSTIGQPPRLWRIVPMP